MFLPQKGSPLFGLLVVTKKNWSCIRFEGCVMLAWAGSARLEEDVCSF